MDNKIKWIHLSDFHVGKDGYEEKKIFVHILTYIKKLLENKFNPDFIFITGDIANHGLKNEYDVFLNDFLTPLIDILQLSEWNEKIFIVPGNHDLERRIVSQITTNKEIQYFQNNELGKETRLMFEGKAFQNYRTFLKDCSLECQDLFENNNGSFVKITNVNEQIIGIIGVNTAWLSRGNNDKDTLTPGMDLLESAINEIKKCNVKILLGHHPLNWFKEQDRKVIESILADNNIIYLHGHLHESRVQPLVIGNGNFLQVQAGACFHVPEHASTLWKNGLLLTVLDDMSLQLQPRYWKDNERRWGILDDLHEDMREKDWWIYKLPEHTLKKSNVNEDKIQNNFLDEIKGWSYVNEDFFSNSEKIVLSDDTYLKFFDGAISNWNREFLKKLPIRDGTNLAIKVLIENFSNSISTFILLTGAGGEGKSTGIMQCVLELYEKNWHIYYHTGSNDFSLEYLKNVVKNKPLIIVSDNAHNLIKNVKEIIDWANKEKVNINFLLASRQSDWNSASLNDIKWRSIIEYKEIKLEKLSMSESKQIIELWTEFGEKGLLELYSLPIDIAIQKLYKASEDHLEKGDGAFLGAMLEIRWADGLKKHVKELLDRLDSRIIHNTTFTLLDAFAVIAHMHTKDLEFLSTPILAQYLFGDSEKSIKTEILYRLGKEAAANKAGDYIYTRHSLIAKAACELLLEEFNYDSTEMYISLGICAAKARPLSYIPNFEFWQYRYPKYFIDQKENFLGITIAKKQFDQDPSNCKLLTNLANLYREIGQNNDSAKLFRTFEGNINDDRVIYHEWAMAERANENIELSYFLDAISVSDAIEGNPPSNENAKRAFYGLCESFYMLFNKYNDISYLNLMSTCAILAIKLQLTPDNLKDFSSYLTKALSEGAKTNLSNISNEFNNEIQSLIKITTIDKNIKEKIPQKKKVTFNKLFTLLNYSETRKQNSSK